MGKNLKNADLVLRTGKVAFYHVPGQSAYTRMEGFTSLSTSKNPTEYERQYVDEDFKRTDITGYNTAIAYALDRYKKHPVTDDIIGIHENELLGQDAVRSIINVDMTTAQQGSNGIWLASAKMRDYAVIPDADGDTTDCMTYSGNFKTRGEMEDVTVFSTDDFQTITLSTNTKPVLKTLSVSYGSENLLKPTFKSDITEYTVSKIGSLSVYATAESNTFSITVSCNGKSSSITTAGVAFTVKEGDYIYITVTNGTLGSNTYAVKCSAS